MNTDKIDAEYILQCQDRDEAKEDLGINTGCDWLHPEQARYQSLCRLIASARSEQPQNGDQIVTFYEKRYSIVSAAFDPFVDVWTTEQLRGATFAYCVDFLDLGDLDYWYWEDDNYYPFEFPFMGRYQ